jgi:diguanylate cyclase (GGDEF)-like protein
MVEPKKFIKSCDGIIFDFIDAMSRLDLAIFLIDRGSYIVDQNSTSKRWFGDMLNLEYKEFCDRVFQDICSMDSMEILAKNSKRYKITSIEINSPENGYTLLILKELINHLDYLEISNKRSSSSKGISCVLARDEFVENVKNIIYEADIIHSKVALLFIEIANLSDIIDTYGKKNGDGVLNIVAKRLKHSLRESDVIGKFDYNKFAVAISGIDGVDIPKKISKKIIYNISRPITTEDGHKINIDIMVGISLYPNDSKDINSLISRADMARYSMKIKSKKWLLSFI